MKISIITLFPEMFQGPFTNSIIKHAQEKNLVEIEYINIRDFGIGKHKVIDDTPYGGGIGMVMRVDVLHQAIEHTKSIFKSNKNEVNRLIILMSASGKPFKQQKAQEISNIDHLILICGHYEGIDARISKYIYEELSIGDFVVTGGELPAMLITDAVVRLLPGVLKQGATENESYSYKEGNNELIEYPHYTKPAEYDGMTVPEILISGNHRKIAEWRHEQALNKTKEVRPELLKDK